MGKTELFPNGGVNMKAFFKMGLLLVICFCVGACAVKKPDYLAYSKKSFRAEIEGSLYGTDFCACIEVADDTDPEGKEALRRYAISYRAPEVLEGVSVVVLRNLGTGEEEITASLGEISLPVSKESVKGWLLPMESLLSVSQEEIESLKKTEVGYRIVFPDEKILVVDEKGMPISLCSDKISFSVTKIQALE